MPINTKGNILVVVQTKLEESDLAELDKIAKANERSRTGQLRFILKGYLAGRFVKDERD